MRGTADATSPPSRPSAPRPARDAPALARLRPSFDLPRPAPSLRAAGILMAAPDYCSVLPAGGAHHLGQTRRAQLGPRSWTLLAFPVPCRRGAARLRSPRHRRRGGIATPIDPGPPAALRPGRRRPPPPAAPPPPPAPSLRALGPRGGRHAWVAGFAPGARVPSPGTLSVVGLKAGIRPGRQDPAGPAGSRSARRRRGAPSQIKGLRQ